jgi:hypothetical protein
MQQTEEGTRTRTISEEERVGEPAPPRFIILWVIKHIVIPFRDFLKNVKDPHFV